MEDIDKTLLKTGYLFIFGVVVGVIVFLWGNHFF
jgi:uncharacterized membrane protein